jgi:uncharacterized protein
MIRLLAIAVGFVVALYAVIVAAAYFGQAKLLFVPDTAHVTPQSAGLPAMAEVEPLGGYRSWWHAPSSDDAPIILYLHGNGGALSGRVQIFDSLIREGFGVLAVGYPGYGGTPGQPGEAEMQRIARANYGWLRGAGFPARRIVIMGHSMGTGVAVALAAQHPAAGLVLESPFTSMRDAAQRVAPWLPVRWIITEPFDSKARIGAVRMPIAWMHGSADTLIPYRMGAELVGAASVPVCALRIDGGGHDDLWSRGGREFAVAQANAMVGTGKCAE